MGGGGNGGEAAGTGAAAAAACAPRAFPLKDAQGFAQSVSPRKELRPQHSPPQRGSARARSGRSRRRGLEKA